MEELSLFVARSIAGGPDAVRTYTGIHEINGPHSLSLQ